jgi:hypothetical protein
MKTALLYIVIIGAVLQIAIFVRLGSAVHDVRQLSYDVDALRVQIITRAPASFT